MLDRIRTDPRLDDGSDVLETYLEDFRTHLQERIERARTPAPAPPPAAAPPAAAPKAVHRTAYLIYDQRDASAAAAWADRLFEHGVEVLHPLFDGDEADIREYHDETLRMCDGVVLFFGAANEAWLRRRMRELQKAAGYGRTLPPPALAICLIEPRTPEKDRFRTHEGTAVRAWDGEAAATLAPFIARLREPGAVD